MARKQFNHLELDIDNIDLQRIQSNGHRWYESKEKNICYPSVTTVISSMNKSDGLKKWRDKLGHDVADAELVRASTRGTKMHTLIEEYISGQDASIKDVLPRGLFDLIRPEVDNIDNIYMLETRMYSEELMMAGTVDCVAEYKGILSVIDFKSSNKFKPEKWVYNYYLQATAYSVMANKFLGVEIPQVVLLIAGEDGSLASYVKNIDDNLITEIKELSKQYHGSYNILNEELVKI